MTEIGQDKIRKQVYELTEKDLAEYRVWEFASDEEYQNDQDEATVKPIEQQNYIDFNGGIFIVKAIFSLNDGTTLTGYVTPDKESDIGTMQPTIVTKDGQIVFWYGMNRPTKEELEESYKQLNRSAKEIFPVTFRSDPGIESVSVEGDINGFAFSPNPENNRVVVTT